MRRPRTPSDVTHPETAGKSWRARYGFAHRLERIVNFPAGVRPPAKVRIYRRMNHFIIQFWDPAAKKNHSIRVEGDLIDALSRAREIEGRLDSVKSSGLAVRKLRHSDLVDQYLADLERRANAGEVAVDTVSRYTIALRHFKTFTEQFDITKTYPHAGSANREFRLAFGSYLSGLQISPNGHAAAHRQPLRGQQFIVDCVRSLFEWAGDPDRGNLLPQGFRNPFLRAGHARRAEVPDQFGEPDITVAMAHEFISNCDAFQLPLFSALTLYGLRAAEPAFLFREHIEPNWIKVPCLPELTYLTKGHREKRFPLFPPLVEMWQATSGAGNGLLFTHRGAGPGDRRTPLFGSPLSILVAEFRQCCTAEGATTAAHRQRLRDQVFQKAGGLNYDQIEHEFHSVARRLKWPRAATLKDFRHLFSTCLANSGVPEFYRKYLMGQSPGRAPIATYTHLNQLNDQYQRALQHDLAPIVSAITVRAKEVGFNVP